MEKITTGEVVEECLTRVRVDGLTMATYEVRKEGPPPTIDPEVFQRAVRLIDEYIAHASWLPPHLLGGIPTTTYEPQPITLEQLQQLRDTWMPVFRGTSVPQQPVRDYCGECYYSNKGVRFCGLGLTMQVGCTQREMEHEQEGERE